MLQERLFLIRQIDYIRSRLKEFQKVLLESEDDEKAYIALISKLKEDVRDYYDDDELLTIAEVDFSDELNDFKRGLNEHLADYKKMLSSEDKELLRYVF